MCVHIIKTILQHGFQFKHQMHVCTCKICYGLRVKTPQINFEAQIYSLHCHVGIAANQTKNYAGGEMAAFEFISNSDLISLSTFSCAQRYSSRQTMFFLSGERSAHIGVPAEDTIYFPAGQSRPRDTAKSN